MREALAATIVTQMLLEGVYFESSNIWRLPFNRESVRRTFRNLVDSGVIAKSKPRGKYLLTEGYMRRMKKDIVARRTHGVLVQCPDFAVFEACGLEDWTVEELDIYTGRLRKRWLAVRGASTHPVG